MKWTNVVLVTGLMFCVFASRLTAEEADRQTELFKQLDTDGDGKLVRSEVPKEKSFFFERLVKKGDGDGDGALSQSEFVTAIQSRVSADVETDRRKGKGRPAGKAQNAPRPGQIFKRFDKNGDGKVTSDEVPEQARKRFTFWLQKGDKDGDGALTRKEFVAAFRAAQRRQGGPKGAAQRRGLFVLLDADHDGKLSRDELEQAAKLIETLDRDGDGMLSPREIVQIAPTTKRPTDAAPAGGPKFLKRFDKDGDGKVSQEEARGRLKKRFARLDANSDGYLDSEELAGARSKKKKPKEQDF